jgi:hypothetical protein
MRPNAEIERPDDNRTNRNDHTKTVFVIRLRAPPDRNAIRELRALLKVALRRHGFCCLSLREEGVERRESAA